MRIAIVAHCHHPIAQPYAGGLEAHTGLVADELVRRGHRVTLFAKAGTRTKARLSAVLPHSYRHRSPADDLEGDRAFERAASIIRAKGFDAVLNNSLNPVPYQALNDQTMLTVLHTPATLDRINALIDTTGWTPGPRHGFAAVSNVTRAGWLAQLPGVDIDLIPNGIDLPHWAPIDGARPEPDLAVWAARITPEKGLPVAIAAARAAGFRFAFSGPIADRRHFTDDVEPLLGPDVTYVGHLSHDELPGFLQRGAVFVSSPNWPEPFGLALVEAMAGGTPAAALPQGAAAEVVAAEGGILARDTSVDALAEAITGAAHLDRDGVRHSVQRFARSRMIDAYEAKLTALQTQPSRDPQLSEQVA